MILKVPWFFFFLKKSCHFFLSCHHYSQQRSFTALCLINKLKHIRYINYDPFRKKQSHMTSFRGWYFGQSIAKFIPYWFTYGLCCFFSLRSSHRTLYHTGSVCFTSDRCSYGTSGFVLVEFTLANRCCCSNFFRYNPKIYYKSKLIQW